MCGCIETHARAVYRNLQTLCRCDYSTRWTQQRRYQYAREVHQTRAQRKES